MAATRKPKAQVKVRPAAVVKPAPVVKPSGDKKAKLVAALKRLHPMD